MAVLRRDDKGIWAFVRRAGKVHPEGEMQAGLGLKSTVKFCALPSGSVSRRLALLCASAGSLCRSLPAKATCGPVVRAISPKPGQCLANPAARQHLSPGWRLLCAICSLKRATVSSGYLKGGWQLRPAHNSMQWFLSLTAPALK